MLPHAPAHLTATALVPSTGHADTMVSQLPGTGLGTGRGSQLWQAPGTIADQPIAVFYYGGSANTPVPNANFDTTSHAVGAGPGCIVHRTLDLAQPIVLAANDAANLTWFVSVIGLTEQASTARDWAQGFGGSDGTYQFIRGSAPIFRALGEGGRGRPTRTHAFVAHFPLPAHRRTRNDPTNSWRDAEMKQKRTIEIKDAQADAARSTANPVLTTADGAPIGAQHALTAGPRGPLLAQDTVLLEQMQHFNRERIPERVVHAKGAGAYGHFTVTNDITRLTRARLFGEVGRKTELFTRFSTATGERGSADAERDIRGFAVKFYTDEGNWDLVGNNTPVFFVRDPYRFAGLVHSQKRHPQTNLRDPNMQWDFYSQCPETMHQLTILFSDRGCPAGYRHMHGYGSHTYSLVNEDGTRVWCKFHLKTRQGIRNLTDAEASRVIGEDRDSAQRDLFEAIARGEFPRWRVCIQVMTEEQSRSFRWNPFDLTKIWPHAEFPLLEIGELELTRNPLNHFAEVEQAAFKPSATVPGIGPSPDRMLQARLMSYADAQLHRLGPNPQQIPVNAPRCPVANFLRDGAGAKGSYGGLPNYWPNSIAGTPKPDSSFTDPAWRLGESIAARYDTTADQDDFTQAGDLYRKFDDAQRQRLAVRIAQSLRQARMELQLRQLVHFHCADPDYAARVAKELGIDARQLLAAADAAKPARKPLLATAR